MKRDSKIEICSWKGRNILGRRENTGYYYFLSFSTMFSEAVFLRVIKNQERASQTICFDLVQPLKSTRLTWVSTVYRYMNSLFSFSAFMFPSTGDSESTDDTTLSADILSQ